MGLRCVGMCGPTIGVKFPYVHLTASYGTQDMRTSMLSTRTSGVSVVALSEAGVRV